jgi:hypothetical protein
VLLLTTFALLTGMLLGYRYNMLVLAPGILCAVAVAAFAGTAARLDHGTILSFTAAVIISLEFGYLCGLAARPLAAMIRIARVRRQT